LLPLVRFVGPCWDFDRSLTQKRFWRRGGQGRGEAFAGPKNLSPGPKNAFFLPKRSNLSFFAGRKKAKLCANFQVFEKRGFCDLKCQGRRGGPAPGAEVAGPSPSHFMPPPWRVLLAESGCRSSASPDARVWGFPHRLISNPQRRAGFVVRFPDGAACLACPSIAPPPWR